ncbi:activated leukocyte cell adhesion molecule b isoform X4 [Hoplias malabaricus]|uniref:activated leukocyte cell adhesion molecule b isoform X4 n=1 Tax=Hoplias malabaricus TaxID=27720 RepID=UPI003462A39C
MRLTLFSAGALLFLSLLSRGSGLQTIVGQYGEVIEVPCNKGNAEDFYMIKWKYTKSDSSTGDLVVKSSGLNATITPDMDYNGRISLKPDFSLLITQAKLSDQKRYTCMVVMATDIFEYEVQVTIRKAPSPPTIANQATEMKIGTLTMLGECSTKDANPPAKITWLKNKIPLVNDDKVTKITSDVRTDKVTGLSSTFSKLEYAAVKGDLNAKFSCAVQHITLDLDLETAPVTFIITYPTEKVKLQVVSANLIKEGDNVTLKCKADGNPPPSSYSFHIKGKKMKVENSDNYTLTNVSRANTGEYKCSLVDNDAIADSVNITVMYLDIANVSKGRIIKNLDESFEATLVVNASGESEISWSKNNVKLSAPAKFDKLKYSDSGVYESVVSMAGLIRKASFELVVLGAPVINKLTKHRSNDGNFKVLKCEAEGSPKPTVQWSINGTNATESPYVDGRVTHTITIIPTVNLTVNCTVSNDLGQASKGLDVSTLFEEVTMDKQEDSNGQARVAVGVVIGVILAALAIGLIYWVYMKRTRQGSWKTAEKEDDTLEESKKLEENPCQKSEA